MDQNIRQIYKGRPPSMCVQHNVKAIARENTGHNAVKGDGIETKISDPAGYRTRAAEMECRDSTDNTTTTDPFKLSEEINYFAQNIFL